MASLEVELLPVLADNYSYLLLDRASGTSGVVDPAEAAPVLARLRALGRGLNWAFITHHHGDHSGNLKWVREELKAEMYADVVLSLAPRSALVLPEDAVIETGTRKLVFVVENQGPSAMRLVPREVTTGERAEDLYEITSGLAENEQVAVAATFLLDSESRLQAALADSPLAANKLGGFLDDVAAARTQGGLTRETLTGTSLALAVELGFGAEPPADAAALFSGNALLPGSRPVAQAYAGHQFGGFSPSLGDGRALLLGECRDGAGRLRDIALKGSGRTPFSRGGDGLAAVAPMLRELLIGEGLHALGVPSTRALAVVASGASVLRERPLPGAVLTRVADSHLRVGSFQYFAARGELDTLRALAAHAMARHGGADPLQLLQGVAQRQARLIAQWMNLGFIHGVMNTDNVAVSGETIDYNAQVVGSGLDHRGIQAEARRLREQVFRRGGPAEIPDGQRQITALAAHLRAGCQIIGRREPVAVPVVEEAVVAQVIIIVRHQNVEHHARKQLMAIPRNLATHAMQAHRIGHRRITGIRRIAGLQREQRQCTDHVAAANAMFQAFAIEALDQHHLAPIGQCLQAHARHRQSRGASEFQRGAFDRRHVEGIVPGRELGDPFIAINAHHRLGSRTTHRRTTGKEHFKMRGHRLALLDPRRGIQQVMQIQCAWQHAFRRQAGR